MPRMPVGLWHYGDTIACCLEGTPYDSGAKGGVIDIGIAGEKNDVEFGPASQLTFFLGRGKKIGKQGEGGEEGEV